MPVIVQLMLTSHGASIWHWNGAIVADGRIALPEGDANQHALNGVLDIYRFG